MSSFDLTGKKIRNTYQRLIQISGSNLVNGTGSLIDNVTLTGSFTGSFIGGFGDGGIESIESSALIKSKGFEGQTSASLGLSPAGFVIYSGSSATTLGADTLQGTGFKFVGPNNSSSISFTDQNDGDVEIKTDKFTLQNSGDITASNALFSGTAIAQNFLQKSVVVHDTVFEDNPSNFSNYFDLATLSTYNLVLDGGRGGEILNNVEFKLDESDVVVDDIILLGDETLTEDKAQVTLRVRSDSARNLFFNLRKPDGSSFDQTLTPGNIYTFEISYDRSGTKTTTALTATDLSIPVTASENGYRINGDIYATNFYGTASYASYAVSASHEIIKEVSSSFADTASFVNPLNQDVQITGSLDVSGSGRFTDVLTVQNIQITTGSNNTNTGVGYQALQSNTGSDSNGFGYQALFSNQEDGANGFGYQALYNNRGSYSNGFGSYALYDNTGVYSSGFGNYSLRNNTGAQANGFGYFALVQNSGDLSNGFGNNALYNNTGNYSNGFGFAALANNTGNFSNGFGHVALQNNSGSNNTAIGHAALQNNSGSNNTAIGHQAAYESGYLTGSNNTFLGALSSYGTNTTIENSTAVGANVTLTDSNTVILGSGSNVGIGTTSPDASAILDIASTTKGVVFPRMTSAQRTSISSPTTGLIVYQTDSTEGLYIYKSTGWVQII